MCLRFGLVGFSRFLGSRPRAGFFAIRPSAIASSRMPARTPSARRTVVAERPAPVIDADQFRTPVAATLLTGTAPHTGSTWTPQALSSMPAVAGFGGCRLAPQPLRCEVPDFGTPFGGSDEIAPVHLGAVVCVPILSGPLGGEPALAARHAVRLAESHFPPLTLRCWIPLNRRH